MPICKGCGNEYPTRRPIGTYCTHACAAKHTKVASMETRICTVCSSSITKRKARWGRSRGALCSKACRRELSRRIGLTQADALRAMRPPDTEETRAAARTRISGSNAPWWKGGRFERSDGYVLVSPPANYPFPESILANRKIREHRMVMELHIGRALLSTEFVHHINGIRNDNRLENLELMSNRAEHMEHHDHLPPLKVGAPCVFNCGRNSGIADDGKHYKACKRCRENRSLARHPHRDDAYATPQMQLITRRKVRS